MAEPTGSTVALVAVWLSSAVMALLGVDYYALVWGIIGAVFTMALAKPESRKAAVISATSALAGAALAGLMANTVGGGRPALIAFAFLAAAGAKVIVSAAIRAIEARIKAAGGKTT